MKKRLVLLLVAVLSLSVFVACGDKSATSLDDQGQELTRLVIGVSPAPHAEIIEFIQEDLRAAGLEVEIKEFLDYVTPNSALDSGDIDLNFFQHLPYLEEFKAQENLDLVSLGGVHIEPLALYSNKLDDIKDLQEGAVVALPNDTSNGARALLLLENQGLIKLRDSQDLTSTEKDIVENPLKLKITPMEAAAIPRVLDDLDAAIINGNYALENGLNPLKDGLLLENEDSPYVNIIAARAEDKDREDLGKFMEVLQSPKVRDFLLEKYDGTIVPAFTK